MALTGFTREGTCTDRVDDAGSHHVCIEMDGRELLRGDGPAELVRRLYAV